MKRSVSELLRLACIYAEQDRLSMADCDTGEYGKEARNLAMEIRAYRMKRWGKTQLEADLAKTTSVPINEIFKKMKP